MTSQVIAVISSILTCRDVVSLYKRYNISDSIPYVLPEVDDAACNPPLGYITIYEVHLKVGLHIQLAKELGEILRVLEIPMARLHPSAF
ncbi:hypothetical protein Nepgr_023211 [Nepenthes gracilis]|uniref:Uncharacterized protein n=1 Tax=Nepenthes gracilis TaxID=150966 RepID=A0AAD3T2F0_NEPGR|nr:hypothetical protein Nepgr_023211 [Nepenthes gracilis]